MATKPTDLVRFAADGTTDADSPNIALPDAALRDTGYALDAVPSSRNFNYYLNRYYRWLKYLSDGAFSGASSFDAALAVAGQFTASAAAIIRGAVTIGAAPVTFASHAFTASAGADTLTITAHGLVTGDGPFQVSNTGGALPAPLAAATNYWVVVLDANTVQLATSFANALAAVVIDLTTAGTGTQSIVAASATRAANTSAHGSLTVDGALSVGGAAAIGGAATIGGAVVVGGTISIAGGVTGGLAVSGSVSATGTVTATGGVVVGANNDVVLSGDGRVVHGTMEITYSGGIATVEKFFGGTDAGPVKDADGVIFFDADHYRAGSLGATSGRAFYSFALPVGARLLSWSLKLDKQTTSASTITAHLNRIQFNSAFPVGTTQTNAANSPGTIVMGEAGLNHTIVGSGGVAASGAYYRIDVADPGSGSGTGTDQTKELTITWDQQPI